MKLGREGISQLKEIAENPKFKEYVVPTKTANSDRIISYICSPSISRELLKIDSEKQYQELIKNINEKTKTQEREKSGLRKTLIYYTALILASYYYIHVIKDTEGITTIEKIALSIYKIF
jgi:hypothetical protein